MLLSDIERLLFPLDDEGFVQVVICSKLALPQAVNVGTSDSPPKLPCLSRECAISQGGGKILFMDNGHPAQCLCTVVPSHLQPVQKLPCH
jgi:hypothetical protein